MKCYSKPIRKYYKYVYTPWTQPVFNSDATWGHLACSSVHGSYYAFRALDGVYPNTADNYGNTWETNGTQTGWWKWQFDMPLRVRSIKIYPRATGGGAPINVDVLYKLYTYDQSELLGSYTLLATQYPTDFALFEFNEPRILNGIYVYKDSTAADLYCGIGELVIDADIVHTVVVTEDDYDFYVDCNAYTSCPHIKQDKLKNIPNIYYDSTHKLLENNYLEVPPGSNCLWISHPTVFPYTAFTFYRNWEFQLKILRTAGTESFFRLFHLGDYYRAVDWFEYNGDFRIATGHAPNHSWTDHLWGSDGIPFCKWVWIRLRKTGAHYVCSQSLDGITYRDKVAFDHSFDWPFWAIQLMEGVKGIIDLNESYLKQWADDEAKSDYWWRGVRHKKVLDTSRYDELTRTYTKYEMAGNHGN